MTSRDPLTSRDPPSGSPKPGAVIGVVKGGKIKSGKNYKYSFKLTFDNP